LPRTDLVAQRDLPFRRHALDGEIGKLVAVHRVGQRPAVRVLAGNRQAQQQAHGLVGQAAREVGRRAAAVLHMAAAAGARDEVRAQAVARGGRRRRLHPVALEKRIADDEARALLIGQVGQGNENAFWPVANTVVSPPVFSSSGAAPACAAGPADAQKARPARPATASPAAPPAGSA
jgi:hypothetical protein